MFDEILKLFLAGKAWPTFQALVRQNLWDQLFPGLFADPSDPPPLVAQTLKNTDERIREGLPVTPGFLFAAFLWPRVKPRADQLIEQGMAPGRGAGRGRRRSDQCPGPESGDPSAVFIHVQGNLVHAAALREAPRQARAAPDQRAAFSGGL